jgi:benzoyl-CoA reductase/2-hydroxyglutaryl-CoA dehydratase subunit BcrC/BadD/HgdB
MEFCEYKPEETAKEYPRVKEAFKRLQLTDKDILNGKNRAIKYYQCDLRGMRMILGTLVRGVVDMILSKDEGKLRLWLELPMGMMAPFLGTASLLREDVVVAPTGIYHQQLMGAIFDKIDFLIAHAESRCLPQGDSHCGCNQSRYALKSMGIVPIGDLNMAPSNYCDEAPKVDEAISRELGERVFYLNRPQDEYLYEPPGTGKHLEYYAGSIEMLRRDLSEVAGVEITDDLLKQNLMHYLMLVAEIRKIEELRAVADPQVMRSTTYDFLFDTYLFTPGQNGNQQRLEALRVLQEELKGMMERGEGVVEKGAPRILYAPHNSFVNPVIGYTLEEAGLNLCCVEMYGNEAVRTDELAAMFENAPASVIFALLWLHLPVVFMQARADTILKGINKGNIDAAILLAHHTCRVYGSDMLFVKNILRKELGPEFPVAVMEYDIYDPKYYAEQIVTRLQSFAEMVRANKALSAKSAA